MFLDDYIETSYPLIKSEGSVLQKTLYFKIGRKNIKPGQFFMLNYNSSQKPVSVSHYDGETAGFTVESRGECTKKMICAAEGEYFGLTGALGSSFDLKNFKKILIIGGGIGTAPVFFLASCASDTGIKSDVFFGARNKDNILYAESIAGRKNIQLKIYTDDGSRGIKGFVTKDLDDAITNNAYDALYMCGPEIMMKIVLKKLNNKIDNVQISMERYMKCGLGLCGSCVLDDIGLRVCAEGPVFDYETIIKTKEFGEYHRDKNGIKLKF